MNFKILTSIILCLFLSTKLIAQNKTGSEIIQVTKRDSISKIYKIHGNQNPLYYHLVYPEQLKNWFLVG